MMYKIDRAVTGIEGFDDLICGGIPRDSKLLVYGKPGAGKTNFGLEYIYKGAKKHNESGVYVSFEQDEDVLITQAKMFGWDLKKLIDKKKVIVMRLAVQSLQRDFAEKILEAVNSIKAKRLVVDTLSLLSMSPLFSVDEKFTLTYQNKACVAYNEQQFIYNLFNILDTTKTTKMYLTMSDLNALKTIDGISEYLCDGIVHLGFRSLGKSHIRTIEIVKMRRTKIGGGINTFQITDEGIKVNSDE